MNYRFLCAFALFAFLCSCQTPYQKIGGIFSSGGYSDYEVKEGHYFVEVAVNGYTSRSTATKYFYRRVKEVCQENGYTRYRVGSEMQESSTFVSVNSSSAAAISNPRVSGHVYCRGRKNNVSSKSRSTRPKIPIRARPSSPAQPIIVAKPTTKSPPVSTGEILKKQRRCAKGKWNACVWVGYYYEHGQGVEKAPGVASVYYKKACLQANFVGCNNLGLLYALGKGVPKNRRIARKLFTFACDGGNKKGCENLKRLDQ